MKLTPSPKNPRILLDEEGNEVFIFTGLHLDDLREFLAKFNQYHTSTKGFSKRKVEI